MINVEKKEFFRALKQSLFHLAVALIVIGVFCLFLYAVASHNTIAIVSLLVLFLFGGLMYVNYEPSNAVRNKKEEISG